MNELKKQQEVFTRRPEKADAVDVLKAPLRKRRIDPIYEKDLRKKRRKTKRPSDNALPVSADAKKDITFHRMKEEKQRRRRAGPLDKKNYKTMTRTPQNTKGMNAAVGVSSFFPRA